MRPRFLSFSLLLILLIVVNAAAFSQIVKIQNRNCKIPEKDLRYIEKIAKFESSFYNNLFNTKMNDTLLVKVNILGNQNEYKTHFQVINGGKGHGTLGFYNNIVNESFLYKRPEYLKTVIHEISHCMLANNLESPPRWLHEGLAEFCETLMLEDDEVVFAPQPARISIVRKIVTKEPINLKNFMNTTGWGEKSQTPYLYDISYAIIYYLIKKNPSTLKHILLYMKEGQNSIDAIEYSYGGFYKFENDFNNFYKNTLIKVY